MVVLWRKRGGKWTQGDLFHLGGCSFVLVTCANDARPHDNGPRATDRDAEGYARQLFGASHGSGGVLCRPNRRVVIAVRA
jgi:hypothetical protein